MSQGKLYFPGLNGLRFFAAFIVLVSHVEMFKQLLGFRNIWYEPLMSSFGSMGVDLFFVLSGFLITYLLFTEKKLTQHISLRNFYIRRILRIWPLYFMIIALSFFLIPQISIFPFHSSIEHHFGSRLWLYLFILPNIALAFFPGVHYASMSWSVGVEEQFYLIWPFLIRKTRKVLRVILIFMFVFMFIKVLLVFAARIWPQWHYYPAIKELVVMTRLECMAIGGIGAYLLFEKRERALSLIFRPVSQWLAALSIVPVTYLMVYLGIDDLKHWAYAVLFLVIVLNTAANPKTIFRLERGWLDFLGKISYGIYMYQYIGIALAFVIGRKIMPGDKQGGLGFNFAVYAMSIAFVILLAFVSYRFFEAPFLSLKAKFSAILSGDLIHKTDAEKSRMGKSSAIKKDDTMPISIIENNG